MNGEISWRGFEINIYFSLKNEEESMDYLIRLVKALIPEQYHPIVGEIYRICRSFLYIGNRYICPCCGWRFRVFLPFGVKPRPSAQCPRCGSLERHRLLWLTGIYFSKDFQIY